MPSSRVPIPTRSVVNVRPTFVPKSVHPAEIVALVCVVPSGNLIPPEVDSMIPATVKGDTAFHVPMPTLPLIIDVPVIAEGVVVPIPILPAEVMRNISPLAE